MIYIKKYGIALMLIISAWPAFAAEFPYELKYTDIFLLPGSYCLNEYSGTLMGDIPQIYRNNIGTYDRKDVLPIDRCATYYLSEGWDNTSDISRNMILYASPLVFVPQALDLNFKNMITLGTMYLEVYYLTKGFTYIVKSTSQRTRPYMYNSSLSEDERLQIAADTWSENGSFFSGHTSAAFASAVFISKTYTDIYGESVWSDLIWGGTLTLAGITAYSRVRAGKHYPSDVIAGAITGAAIGYFIPELHKKTKDKDYSITIMPGGLEFSYGF